MKPVVLLQKDRQYDYIFFDQEIEIGHTDFICFDYVDVKTKMYKGSNGMHYYNNTPEAYIIPDKKSEEYKKIMQDGLTFLDKQLLSQLEEFKTL